MKECKDLCCQDRSRSLTGVRILHFCAFSKIPFLKNYEFLLEKVTY